LRRPPHTATARSRSSSSTPIVAAAAAPQGTEATAAASAAATPAAAAPQQQRDYFATDPRPVILYDGACNLCNTGVNVVLELDRDGSAFRLAALQSPAGRALLARCGRSPNDISSIVLADKDGCFVKSEAVRRIGARLAVPLPLLAALVEPVPLLVRDFLYDQIANNRYNLFGQSSSCRLGTGDGARASRFIVD
jgi:predicted DCC family thiol-disulfide oxidoreductase YuxK